MCQYPFGFNPYFYLKKKNKSFLKLSVNTLSGLIPISTEGRDAFYFDIDEGVNTLSGLIPISTVD